MDTTAPRKEAARAREFGHNHPRRRFGKNGREQRKREAGAAGVDEVDRPGQERDDATEDALKRAFDDQNSGRCNERGAVANSLRITFNERLKCRCIWWARRGRRPVGPRLRES